ncbi:MAG: DUF3772 domain-containing protein [Hyphomicrobium sp.]|uniref:DUF3772 domain-containing protein n=1 Tax=Hyphomicrobium sp. TaxID=82 RepID=UPI003D12C6DD
MTAAAFFPRSRRPAAGLLLMLLALVGVSTNALAQGQAAPQPKAPAEKSAPGAAQPEAASPATATDAASPAPPPAPVLSAADQSEIDEVQRPVSDLKDEIDRIEKAVQRNLENEEELRRLRSELIAVFNKTRDARDQLRPKSEALSQQIDKLGPPPAKDAPPEAPEVAAERARLGALAAGVDGAYKNTELFLVRTRQIRDTIQAARQELFARHILKRSPSPLAPSTWLALIGDLPGATRQVADTLSGWLALAEPKAPALAAVIAGVVALFLGLTALVRWILATRLDRPRKEPPGFFAQAAAIGWVAPLIAVPGAAAITALGVGLDWLGLLNLEVGQIAATAFPALYLFVAVSALVRAMLQPARSAWRLVDLSTPAARKVTQILRRIAAVFSADLILQEAIRRLFLPLSVGVLEIVLSCVAIALLLLALVRTRFAPKSSAGERPAVEGSVAGAPTPGTISRLRPYLIKLPILATALAILALALAGYIGLARFITVQVLVSGAAIAVVLVLHLAISALLGAPGSGIKPFASLLNEKIGLEAGQAVLLTRALSVLLNVALALVAVPLILVTWGYTPQEAWMWLRALVFGFQIGEFRISLARILLAGLLFLALVAATRITQRWIDAGVAASQRVDQGIANSIHTAVGYAGFIIAALAAVSYGGIDITNFAIVAGALSVGIGFGLQSIINNFVSGLILLVERPIKVGDRVSVKDKEGFVRRISVRSTEIETFDKASIIVPNSDLISSAVTNYTHRNALGTVTVRVRAGYQTDAERVRDILQKIGSECQLLMQHPPPGVLFENFGADGLEFSLTGVISDVSRADAAKSDLRYRILKAFRAAGIEMPFAQYDVHLRDLDLVRVLLARLAEERARKGGATVEPAKDDGGKG